MATTEERLSSNWPPAFPAIRFNYQSQGNGVYRIWQPEILEAAPVVPARLDVLCVWLNIIGVFGKSC